MDRTQMISDYINSVYQSIEEETAQPAAPIGGGLAAKPVKPTVKDDDTEDKRGVLSRIYDTMSSHFKSDDDDDVSAITTSPTTLNNAAKEATLNNASIVDIIKANKDTPTGSAVINIPLSRLYNKYQNISEAMNSDNETWQRVAMLMGWSRWSFGIQNSDVMSAKGEVKEIKAQEKEERKEQKEAERQAENEAVIQGHIEEQQQQRDDGVSEDKITCAAVKRNGERCSNTVLSGQTYCTIHEEVEARDDGKEVQCSHVKNNGDRCKMKTTNKSGKCYYHD